MNIKSKLAAIVSTVTLAAAAYSLVTPEVQAAEAQQEMSEQDANIGVSKAVLFKVVEKQHQLVLDPTGLINPTNPCPWVLGPSPEEASNAGMLEDEPQHVLD